MPAIEHNSGSSEPAATGDISPEVVRAHAARITGSEIFANSSRMQRFLMLAVEYALAGRAKELKEYLVGVEVFDRHASFDPRQDPIVRVEARRLRSKLKEYYEGPGKTDDLLIQFSKGAYAPRFVSRSAAKRSETPPKSIAVLPFRDLGPDPDSQYFSDGLTEELIHLLTTLPGLQVMAWNSSARLKGNEHDLARIRQQLKVDTVLCGTVRRTGTQLRITAQLIDTAEGRYLWSDLYERRMQDLFAIEEDIAWAIVNTLQIRLGTRPVSSTAATEKAPDPEARNLYLLGRYYSNRRTSEGLAKSISCFEKAIALDPESAPAYGALAEIYCLAGDYCVGYPSDYAPLAKAAARRALELNPNLAEAYSALAYLKANYDWEWNEAERLFRRAISLNPGYASVRHWYGVDCLALRGKWRQAYEQVELAHTLDPLSPIILQGKGYLHFIAGQYEQALRVYNEIAELDPYFGRTFSAIARVYTQMGRFDEAIELYRKARERSVQPANVFGALGQTYALAGMQDAARATLAEVLELSRHSHVPGTCAAMIYAGLGETDAALDMLELSAERRDPNLTSVKIHPAYDKLRSHPRFHALLAKIGLA